MWLRVSFTDDWGQLSRKPKSSLMSVLRCTESPITAIETLREELGSLEFVAIYENECIRQAVGEQIRSAFEVSGTEMEAGKL